MRTPSPARSQPSRFPALALPVIATSLHLVPHPAAPAVPAALASQFIVDLRESPELEPGLPADPAQYVNIGDPEDVYGGIALPLDCSFADGMHFERGIELTAIEFVYRSFLSASCCSNPTVTIYANDPLDSDFPPGYTGAGGPDVVKSFTVPGLQTPPSQALLVTVLLDPILLPAHSWIEIGFPVGSGMSGAIGQFDLAGRTASADFLVINCPVVEAEKAYYDTDNLNNLAINLYGRPLRRGCIVLGTCFAAVESTFELAVSQLSGLARELSARGARPVPRRNPTARR